MEKEEVKEEKEEEEDEENYYDNKPHSYEVSSNACIQLTCFRTCHEGK